jgi:hypothetical protein
MLRQAGHDAATVLEKHLGGSADAQLAALCQTESRILVTLDMDFADSRNYPPAEFPGLVGSFAAVLNWQASSLVHFNYTVFLQVLGANNNVLSPSGQRLLSEPPPEAQDHVVLLENKKP